METDKSDKKLMNLKFQQEENTFFITLAKQVKDKLEELNILLEDDENETWEFSCSHNYLMELDSIFKKIPDMNDVLEIIAENVESGTLQIENCGEYCYFSFRVKFIKIETTIKIALKKKITEKNPIIDELKTLRKELELLKQKNHKKIPVINFVGQLNNGETISGELTLKVNATVLFKVHVEYKTIYGSNCEESLGLQINNEKFGDDAKEKIIYKTWFGIYNYGSGYHDCKTIKFDFSEKICKGKNKITLKKNGTGSNILTLYLFAKIL